MRREKMVGFPYIFFRIFIHWRLISFQHVAISKPEIMQILNMDFFTIFDDGKHKKFIFGAVFGADHIAVDAIGEL